MRISQDKQRIILSIFLLLFIVIWVSCGFYQSHYLSALRTIGDYATQNILGVPKEGRGDEWSTYLPMLKQAYLEGFPKKSMLAPYFENLDWFIAIPKLDASLLFLPNQIAYWILPGANALSFQGIYYNFILILSVYFLLKNLGARSDVAFFAAIMLLFSHFYQVWWTSNFPALGAGILPFAVFTCNLRSRYKFPLLFWAIAHMLFGQVYPPFYVSMLVALLPFIFAVRTDLISIKNITLATICAVGALSVFLLLRWDFVIAVAGTSYPGIRISTGGGVNFHLLLSAIFPTIPAGVSITPIDTVHEFSLVGTIFPLLFLSILPKINWDNFSIRITLVTAITLIILSLYMIVGFPVWLSKITLFYLVPGRRMLIGASVLILIYVSVMISRHWHQLRGATIALACIYFSIIVFLCGVRTDIQTDFYGINWYWIAPSLLVISGIPILTFFEDHNKARDMFIRMLLSGMAIFHIVVYGSFNPIMNSKDILKPADTQLTRDVIALVSASPEKAISVIGNFGHVLRGEGLPVFNAIHLVNVDRVIYQNLYNISKEESNALFNQFRGISFNNIEKLDPSGATVTFPAKFGGVLFKHDILNAIETPSLIENIEIRSAIQNGRSFNILWNAKLLTPLPISSKLVISTPCRVSKSWLTRYPISHEGKALVDVALQGVAGELWITADSLEMAKNCSKAISLSIEN